MTHIDYCWYCKTYTKHNGQWCCKCGKSEHEEFDNLPRIADVKLKCPECGLITTVGKAEPDIDGEGSLGCPKCLYVMKKKIVMNEA